MDLVLTIPGTAMVARERGFDLVLIVGSETSQPQTPDTGSIVVRKDSAIKVNADVDKAGTHIAVAAKSAYDLFLTREIKQATLERTVTSGGVIDMFIEKKFEVAAGVKQQLEKDMKRLPGLRMLDGRFMEINQAMGTSKGRDEGIKYMRAFIEEMKTSGFVAKALERHKIEGVAVAPAAR